MANTFIHRTPSSASNRRTWTWSAWIKRSGLTSSSNGHTLWETEGSNGGDNFIFQIKGSNDTLHLHTYGNDVFTTTRKLKDTAAWYHVVLAMDTTQGTAANRIKLYLNGELQTYSAAANFPSQNFEFGINKNHKHCIGSHGTNANYYFDGLMSHIHFCDGSALAPTVFGSVDSTTGEWKINTAPSFTPGTNGYTVLKDGNTITDQSANSNNFTSSGAGVTNTKDCPDNNFATWNPLLIYVSEIPTFSEGNTKVSPTGNSSRNYAISTIAMPRTGKWYSEFKKLQNDNVMHIGILDTEIATARFQANAYVKDNAGGIVYDSRNGTITGNNSIQQSGLASSGNGDIIGLAIDMDSSLFYVYKNGTLLNTSGTGVNFSSFITGSYVAFFVGDGSSSGYDSCQANFGNGYFGTSAVSSAGTNASNNGIFEYNVPSGYTALSTKGLNL